MTNETYQDKPRKRSPILSNENVLNDPLDHYKKPSREPTESELQELVDCTDYCFGLLDPTPGFIEETLSPHMTIAIKGGAVILMEYGEKYQEIGKKFLERLACRYQTAARPMFIDVGNPQTRLHFNYCEEAVEIYLQAGNIERARKLLDSIKQYVRPSRLTEDMVCSAERENQKKEE